MLEERVLVMQLEKRFLEGFTSPIRQAGRRCGASRDPDTGMSQLHPDRARQDPYRPGYTLA
jgi:hypothetical protein